MYKIIYLNNIYNYIDNIADTITDRVLELSGKNKQLTQWLEELLIDNIDNNKGWNIKSDLKGMVKEIINRPIVNAFSNAISVNDYQTYVRDLKNNRKNILAGIQQRIIAIRDLVINSGYTSDDFKSKSNFEQHTTIFVIVIHIRVTSIIFNILDVILIRKK